MGHRISTSRWPPLGSLRNFRRPLKRYACIVFRGAWIPAHGRVFRPHGNMI